MLCAAAVGKLTRHSFVFDCVELIARGGKIGKTDYLNGNGRTCTLYIFSVVVNHGAHTTDSVSDYHIVALVQGTVLYKHGSDRTSSAVELRLDDDALRALFRIGAELLDLCDKEHALEQLFNTLTGHGRDGDAYRVASPCLGDYIVLGELIHYVIGVRVRLIHLVDGDYYIYSRRLCVV